MSDGLPLTGTEWHRRVARVWAVVWPLRSANETARADQDTGEHVRVEERIARGIAATRVGMLVLTAVPLLPLPFVRWRRPASYPFALAGRLVAFAGTIWSVRRMRQQRTTVDPVLIAGDTGISLAVMALLSRSVAPDQRNSALVSSLSFTLASAGLAGLGAEDRRAGLLVPVVLACGWQAATWPDISMKTRSDALGYFLWYGVCQAIGRGFRDMAAASESAHAAMVRAQQEADEQRRLAEVVREQERAYRMIHDYLLPIVDAVAAGQGTDDRLVAMAQSAARQARAMLGDGRALAPHTFAAMLADARDAYEAAGLALATVFRIEGEPPPEVTDAIVAAAREALSNVLKHAGNLTDVTFFAEAAADRVEVVIRDHGAGFDSSSVRLGGGLGRTYRLVQRVGGVVEVASQPQTGTRVRIWWQAPDTRTVEDGQQE